MSWADFKPGFPGDYVADTNGSDIDVAVISTEAPRTRNVQDLGAQIKAAGGAVVVGPNDSRYIVAINNRLRYSVTRLANGQYRITENNLVGYGLAGLLIIGAIVLLSSR